MFPNHSGLPNRISLQEDWYMSWRSIQICYCLRTRGHSPKRVQSQKLKTPLYYQRHHCITSCTHGSGTAQFIKTCSEMHGFILLASFGVCCGYEHCLCPERNDDDDVEFSWYWLGWRNAVRPGREVLLLLYVPHLELSRILDFRIVNWTLIKTLSILLKLRKICLFKRS